MLILAFLVSDVCVHAQGALQLPSLGTLTAGYEFSPALIRGIKYYPQNPFQLDFIVDTGESALEDDLLHKEGLRLIKYFLAALTTPSSDVWVNLSPYESGRIIPEKFGETEMGRDLLAQDYILKHLASALTNPEGGLGKEFWKKVYRKAHELYGTMDIPIDTFSKVWIIPDKALVYENGGVVYIAESHLKVMLDADYVAEGNGTHALQRDILREIILPAIEKEVNEGKDFYGMRQIYSAMILATWYKRNLKESILQKGYADQNKVNGVDLNDKDANEKIYQQYLGALKAGAYSFIKEEYDQSMDEVIPRKYFSGGFEGKKIDDVLTSRKVFETDFAQLLFRDGQQPVHLQTLKVDLEVLSGNDKNVMPANSSEKKHDLLNDRGWSSGHMPLSSFIKVFNRM
ncbi:MAG: hypothetical protein V2A70_06575, partial [Candidatus Omnitrophota bacterium]